MLKNKAGVITIPSFREVFDFSKIKHNCRTFNWREEAFLEENSHVFMCYLPEDEDEALGLISLIPFVFEDNPNSGGYIEIYLIESSHEYAGTYLVAWACKMGFNLFGENIYFTIKALPKDDDAIAFFEAIGAEMDNIGNMIIFPEAAKSLVHKCKI